MSSFASPALLCVLVTASSVEPIVELEDLVPEKAAFADSRPTKPIELRSEDDAEKYFEGKSLETLLDEVDFDEQVVLVFAWRGSGRDRLSHVVAESAPEQVRFTYRRGLTRDLRPHVHVFALRSDVKWSVAGKRPTLPGRRGG